MRTTGKIGTAADGRLHVEGSDAGVSEPEPARCEWIEEGRNCIALGPFDGGKAHAGLARNWLRQT